jgi:hypothetical protein
MPDDAPEELPRLLKQAADALAAAERVAGELSADNARLVVGLSQAESRADAAEKAARELAGELRQTIATLAAAKVQITEARAEAGLRAAESDIFRAERDAVRGERDVLVARRRPVAVTFHADDGSAERLPLVPVADGTNPA